MQSRGARTPEAERSVCFLESEPPGEPRRTARRAARPPALIRLVYHCVLLLEI